MQFDAPNTQLMQKTGNRAKYDKVPAESPQGPWDLVSVHPNCIEAKKELHWSECSSMQKSRESTEASFAGGELHTVGASMVLLLAPKELYT